MARGGLIAHSPHWYSRLGEPLSDEDKAVASGYAQALEMGSLALHLVVDAAAAQAFSSDPDWDCRWWSREEQERQRLMGEAQARLGAAAVLDALSAAVEPHTGSSLQMATASPLLGAADEALARAASGALLMSLHCQSLARLCNRGEAHLFMRKCELFSRGRWPLGVRDQTLFLF